MSTSDHDKLGKAVGGRTMQLDALPEELIDGLVGEGSGYQLADEAGAGPSAPPPLPPRSSAPAGPPAPAGDSKKTMIIAIVVAVLMAVAGVVVGTMVLGEEDPPPAETDTLPDIDFGDIEVQSH